MKKKDKEVNLQIDKKNISENKKEVDNKVIDKEQETCKNKVKSNIYAIYTVLFTVLIVILVVLSMKDNPKSSDNTNRKKLPNLEKTEESLSKNVENAENKSDSEKLSNKKEVHESNKEESEEDKADDKEDDKDVDDGKKVYLTFDDGPSENTAKILSILEKYDAKATFFVVYHKGDKNKKIYKRIVDEGHTIGVHSYTHNYKKIYASEKSFRQDVLKMKNFIKDLTGVETNIYRFPGGSGNQVSKVSIKKCIKVLKEESMIYFDWNVENGDAIGKKLSDKQLVNNVVKNVKNKNTPIVLMHDTETKDATVKTLPKVITSLQKQGYKFVAINEDTPRIQQKK